MAYDPVPDLAAVIDGLQRAARAETDKGLREELAKMMTSYVRIRGGLLLDEPGFEAVSTADALRLAIDG
jgi:hypothetical protein